MPKLKIEIIPLKSKFISAEVLELLRHYNKITLTVLNNDSLIIKCQKKLKS